MDLQTFVTESLNQIIRGIEQAQQSNTGTRINPAPSENRPKITQTEFDIAVTVEKTSQSGDEAKGKILVRTGIFDFGGGVGGDSQKVESNATTSRIKFSVPVALRVTSDEVGNCPK